MIEHQGIVVSVGAYISCVEVIEVEELLYSLHEGPLMLFGTKAIVCGRTFLFVLRKQREGQQYPQAEDKSFQHQSYFLINSSDLYAINNAKRKSAIVLFANLTVLLHISNNMEGLFHYTSSFSLLLLICSFTA